MTPEQQIVRNVLGLFVYKVNIRVCLIGLLENMWIYFHLLINAQAKLRSKNNTLCLWYKTWFIW